MQAVGHLVAAVAAAVADLVAEVEGARSWLWPPSIAWSRKHKCHFWFEELHH